MKTKKRLAVCLFLAALFVLCTIFATGCDMLPGLNLGGCIHEWSDWKIVQEASCTEAGKMTRTCSLCEETEESQIEQKGHDWLEIGCTKTCKVCNTVDGDGHKFYRGACMSCGVKCNADNFPEQLNYTISFNSNGGELDVDSQNVTFGESYTLPTPTKDGAYFIGWYVGEDLFTGEIWDTSFDVQLTAKWATEVCKVTFVDENGEIFATHIVEKGATVSRPNDPEKDGCKFVGWFKSGRLWNFDDNQVNSDITLTVRWVAYVVYHLDGGENDPNNPTTIYSDSEFPIELYDPTKGDYIFLGWYTDPQFTNRATSINSCDSYTLYALWGEKSDGGNDSEYPWETTELRFWMTQNSNGQELPASCDRYLAGTLQDILDSGRVDEYVRRRNDAAYKATNVNILYGYYPDTEAFSWGQTIDRIYSEVKSMDPDRPDMYCNFVYDMVATSLKGSFANLLSTTMYEQDHELYGLNYFEFAENPGMYENTGEGYMWEYMRSLTLSKWKMYCLASDYFIDTIRAAVVVPVNVGLLESLQTGNEEWNMDRVTTFDINGNEESNYTIEDFYALVGARLWNYENLAKFSAAIADHEDGNTGSEGYDIHDTIGFALGTGSGLFASGMLYTTTINIIERVYDPYTCDYVYSYPYTEPSKLNANGDVVEFICDGQHEELNRFCSNLYTLFSTPGVVAVSPDEAGVYSAATAEQTSKDITGIRNRFATGHILFGGVICLGSLEYAEYKDMNAAGQSGYGIVPVPLYRSSYYEDGVEKVDNYMTHIYNLAKVGAISYTTEKFAQCTAFLNYQSTHSTEILNEYYNYKLSSEVNSGGVKENAEMLKFIRNNVRSSFDKTYEDALGRFYYAIDDESMNKQWHTMIMNSNYKFDQMRTRYAEIVTAKALRLYDLEHNVFVHLPV